jgi:hypothetical protein
MRLLVGQAAAPAGHLVEIIHEVLVVRLIRELLIARSVSTSPSAILALNSAMSPGGMLSAGSHVSPSRPYPYQRTRHCSEPRASRRMSRIASTM